MLHNSGTDLLLGTTEQQVDNDNNERLSETEQGSLGPLWATVAAFKATAPDQSESRSAAHLNQSQ